MNFSLTKTLKKRKSNGFALLEVFIAMLIITILISGIVIPGLALNNYQKRKETHARIKHIQTALNNFIITHGRLPCPTKPSSTSIVSTEELQNGLCFTAPTFASGNAYYGGIPTQTLGISQEHTQDGWGNKILYIVPTELTPQITGKPSIVFITDQNQTKIAKINATGNELSYTPKQFFTSYLSTAYKENNVLISLATGHLFALISYGENGFGAYTLFGTKIASSDIDPTIGENENMFEGKTNLTLFTTPSKNLKGGKLDDIVYTSSIQDIIGQNSAIVHCNYDTTPYYAAETTSFTNTIPANSRMVINENFFTNNPHYPPSSLVKFHDTCPTCPAISGRRLYTECLQGGVWGEVVARACTC